MVVDIAAWLNVTLYKNVLLPFTTFCRYLSDYIPDLTVLPVKVTLTLLNKGIQIPDVILSPHNRWVGHTQVVACKWLVLSVV